MKIFELRREILSSLRTKTPTPELDADILISHFLKKDRTWCTFHREFDVCEDEILSIKEAVRRREKGLPVAYITNSREFYGFDFYVDENVLIPKPDTEILVDLALNVLGQKLARRENYIPTVCDMCAGSGCVGISVLRTLFENDGIELSELPKFTLCDISENALSVAKKNGLKLLEPCGILSRMNFILSDLFEFVPFTFDLIVSNPPYVPHSEAESLLLDGRSEPLLALDGNIAHDGSWDGREDGLSVIERLVPDAFSHLCKGGVLIIETGEYNAEAAAEIFKKEGFSDIKIENDLSGKMRCVLGRK